MSALLDSKDYSTREDIKLLEQQISELKMENNSLRKESAGSKEREAERNNRIDYLENQLRAINLVVKGTKE